MFSTGVVRGGQGIVPFFILPEMTAYFYETVNFVIRALVPESPINRGSSRPIAYRSE
jgi:hypothetical protein